MTKSSITWVCEFCGTVPMGPNDNLSFTAWVFGDSTLVFCDHCEKCYNVSGLPIPGSELRCTMCQKQVVPEKDAFWIYRSYTEKLYKKTLRCEQCISQEQ